MDKLSFNIFPNVNFIDLCMYQFGHEQCEPGHSFGPATRNHYLFHYVLSGTGTLMADNAKGITQTYNIKSGQGFLIFPGCSGVSVFCNSSPVVITAAFSLLYTVRFLTPAAVTTASR